MKTLEPWLILECTGILTPVKRPDSLEVCLEQFFFNCFRLLNVNPSGSVDTLTSHKNKICEILLDGARGFSSQCEMDIIRWLIIMSNHLQNKQKERCTSNSITLKT